MEFSLTQELFKQFPKSYLLLLLIFSSAGKIHPQLNQERVKMPEAELATETDLPIASFSLDRWKIDGAGGEKL